MDKVSPTELRVSAQLADEMVAAGIGYIPVPYASDEERCKLLHQAVNRLEELAIETEAEEAMCLRDEEPGV